jgi:hypothetical protein
MVYSMIEICWYVKGAFLPEFYLESRLMRFSTVSFSPDCMVARHRSHNSSWSLPLEPWISQVFLGLAVTRYFLFNRLMWDIKMHELKQISW